MLALMFSAVGPKADINPGSRQVSIPARLPPSRVKVMPDKMAVMTLGGGYGAAIKNWRQDRRGKKAQGKLS
jgi:hypothetical protein